jgi:hypothetical protein
MPPAWEEAIRADDRFELPERSGAHFRAVRQAIHDLANLDNKVDDLAQDRPAFHRAEFFVADRLELWSIHFLSFSLFVF